MRQVDTHVCWLYNWIVIDVANQSYGSKYTSKLNHTILKFLPKHQHSHLHTNRVQQTTGFVVKEKECPMVWLVKRTTFNQSCKWTRLNISAHRLWLKRGDDITYLDPSSSGSKDIFCEYYSYQEITNVNILYLYFGNVTLSWLKLDNTCSTSSGCRWMITISYKHWVQCLLMKISI